MKVTAKICRTYYVHDEITVEANSEAEAEELIETIAGDTDYSGELQYDGHMEVDVVEIERTKAEVNEELIQKKLRAIIVLDRILEDFSDQNRSRFDEHFNEEIAALGVARLALVVQVKELDNNE